MIDGFFITKNEEELVAYCLESFLSFNDQLGVLSVVDNGSTDDTLDIIYSYKDRLPLIIQHERGDAHHGHLRTKAISKCQSPWIVYLDSDETLDRNFAPWLRTGAIEQADVWDIYKYTTIIDRYHFVEGGNGPSTRLFRNLPGVHFPQNVHTEPTHPGLRRKAMIPNVLMFDHTACKSEEALIAKGWRYQVHQGTIGVGPWHEYIGRVRNAHHLGIVRVFDEHTKEVIFTGP